MLLQEKLRFIGTNTVGWPDILHMHIGTDIPHFLKVQLKATGKPKNT